MRTDSAAHWLDDFIADLREPDEIAEAIFTSPVVRALIEQAIARAERAELEGVDYVQFVRDTLVRGFQDPHLAMLEPNAFGNTGDEAEIEQQELAARHRPDERPPNDEYQGTGSAAMESHGADTPEGGSEVGGLAGSNIGDGAPGNVQEPADAQGNWQPEVDDLEQQAYAGPTGGAVGGTPAGKRAKGGRTHGGLAPRETGDDSTIGRNPVPRKAR